MSLRAMEDAAKQFVAQSDFFGEDRCVVNRVRLKMGYTPNEIAI